jgi:alpha-glucoside transport system substrate-binding protein
VLILRGNGLALMMKRNRKEETHMRPARWLWLLALGALMSGALVLSACDDDDDDGDGDGEDTPAAGTPADGNGDGGGGDVSVLGIWGDEELASFEAMVEPWDGSMDFTGTRDITAILTTRVEGGNAPDVAIPAEVGLFQQFAAEGELTPLSECEGLEEQIRATYPQAYIDLGTVDGTLYGFFMKADTKGTIFYNPEFFTANNLTPLEPTATWDDLIALSDQILGLGTPPWSIGQEEGAASGFPGSDVIQQILLNEHGPDVYDAIIAGDTPFSGPEMTDAWEKFGQLALTDGYTVQGSAAAINATNFQDSTFPPYEDPPGAAMVPLGGFAVTFIQDQFPEIVPGEGVDFFTWPGGGVTGAANIAYAFNSDPATCSFLSHIASAEAQQIWVDRGGFTSLNTEVSTDSYPDSVTQGLAEQLLEAEVFRFDLDDAIGGAVQQAVFQGVTEYLVNPDSLASILANIEAARTP